MRVLHHIVCLMICVAVAGCIKNQEPAEVQPVATFKMSPAAGNTTTIFTFNADSVIGQGTRDNPVMVRWDWDSDGTWDRMYSTGGEITHRFFKPGNYKIRMEASTLNGKKDSKVLNIGIEQGYSAPRAEFSRSPDSANITTLFAFDASFSKDDEDSLDQLEFRWDFNGDQVWDTDFSHNPLITFRYQDDSRYGVRLEVRDPQKMTAVTTKPLVVTRLNSLIVPKATHECWPCTLEDSVHLDAKGSLYTGRPDAQLLYSWDVGKDNVWESTLNTGPLFQCQIAREGKTKIRLRVTDDQGLYMDFVDTVEIFAVNSAPEAKIVIGNRIGNTGTRYFLHLRESKDRDNSIMDLTARWDINDDGIWEPEYDGMLDVYLTFPAAGKYPVTAMITDPKNKSGYDTDTVWVVPGNHETGLLEDRRTNFVPRYYGTVKIGNRWWMQSNLAFYPIGKDDKWRADYYNNDARLGLQYGALYPHAAMKGVPDVCPPGWHVPTLDEFRQMMADLGQDANVDRLMEGGRSEMHVLLSGQKDYESNSPAVKDKFSNLGLMTNFWTSSVTLTGQAYAWYIDPIRRENKSVVVGKNYWFPIRCIRNE